MNNIVLITIISLVLLFGFYYFTQSIPQDIIIKPTQSIISTDPKIVYIENFLTSKEIDHLIELCEKHKIESKVEIPLDNTKTVVEKKVEQRTGSTAFLKKGMTKQIINIENKAMGIGNVSYNKIEPLQVVAYKKNQYYKPHMDTFYPKSQDLLTGGNRFATILVYLTTLDDNEKGRTIFPNLDLKFKPKRGDAIYFENMKDGQVDYRLLHEGESLESNKNKYILNIWIREKEYLH